MNDDKNPDMGKFRSEERRLRDVLMESYVSFVRPVFRSRTVTYVYISLSNIQVMSLVSVDDRSLNQENKRNIELTTHYK